MLNIVYIKETLWKEIKKLEENSEYIDDLSTKIDVLESLIENFSDNINELTENMIFFDLQLSVVYDETKSDFINNNIHQYIYSINHTTNIEYKNKMKNELKKLKKKFSKDLQIFKDKLITSENNKKLIVKYFGIINNFNFKKYITSQQVELLSCLFDDEKISSKEQVVLFEKIKIHNQL